MPPSATTKIDIVDGVLVLSPKPVVAKQKSNFLVLTDIEKKRQMAYNSVDPTLPTSPKSDPTIIDALKKLRERGMSNEEPEMSLRKNPFKISKIGSLLDTPESEEKFVNSNGNVFGFNTLSKRLNKPEDSNKRESRIYYLGERAPLLNEITTPGKILIFFN